MKKATVYLNDETKISQIQARIDLKQYTIDPKELAEAVLRRCPQLWPADHELLAWDFPSQHSGIDLGLDGNLQFI